MRCDEILDEFEGKLISGATNMSQRKHLVHLLLLCGFSGPVAAFDLESSVRRMCWGTEQRAKPVFLFGFSPLY